MGTLTTVVSLTGMAVALGALLALGRVSGLAGAGSDLQLLGGTIVAFLFGVFLFGWGLGKRTQY